MHDNIKCTCRGQAVIKNSAGPSLVRLPSRNKAGARIGAIPLSSRRFKEHKGLTLPSHVTVQSSGGYGYVAGTVTCATLK